MITNEILEKKYRTQEELSKITKGNVEIYKKVLKDKKKELEKKYNFKFKYLK